MIHVGINLHTRNMVNVAINDNAEVVRQAKLPASSRALDDFLSLIDEPVQAVVDVPAVGIGCRIGFGLTESR